MLLMSMLMACCCGGGPEPGPCLNPCAIHSVAVTIVGIAKCPDIVNCQGAPGLCPGVGGVGFTPSNTQLFGQPPNGTHVLYPCPAPASGCQFGVNLNQTAQVTVTDCPCGTPWASQPPGTFEICTPAGVIQLAQSHIRLSIDVAGPGGTIRAFPTSRTIVPDARTCVYCCQAFGNPQVATTTGYLPYNWSLPFGNTGVTPANFCAGVPLVIQGTLGGICQPCGFNGPGTWGVNNQASSLITVTIARVN